MPPSAVFSYWRRDHRRSSATPKLAPPLAQVPTIQSTPADVPPSVGTSLAHPEGSSPQTSEYSPGADGEKLSVTVSTAAIPPPSSSSTNLAVPSATSEKEIRPHSSPEEEREREVPLTAQSNHSQPSFTVPRATDQTDAESSKPSSPFRLSLGKSLLHAHHQPSDYHSKRASTPAMAPTSHFRFKPAPDDAAPDKVTAGHKDYKQDRPDGGHGGHGGRRPGDREVSGEHAPHKSGKAMLHLLNPMSLLARRRSSHLAHLRTEEIAAVPAIPDDYDPRIRGKIVHDFSAPRPRRTRSTAPTRSENCSRTSSSQDQPSAARLSDRDVPNYAPEQARKRQSEYAPVFKEHFEDDRPVLQVENKAYLQSSLLTNPTATDRDAQAIPAFARKLPAQIPEDGPVSDNTPSDKPPPDNAPGTSNEDRPQQHVRDADTIDITPHQPLGVPKHCKSNASRFSFDMNAVESETQEKLLEEKHKAKEAARKAKARMDGDFSDAEDDYDNDLFDDFDGLEEKIPGVNVDDDEEDGYDDFSAPDALANKSWLAPGLSPVVASPISPVGPGLPPGASLSTHDLGVLPTPPSERTTGVGAAEGRPAPPPNARDSTEPPTEVPQIPIGLPPSSSQPVVDDDDDDLYFDDGEFGDLTADVGGGETFDESIFDDESSHLYSRKTAAAQPPVPPAEDRDPAPAPMEILSELDELALDPGDSPEGLKHMPSMASDYRGLGSRRVGRGPPALDPAKAQGGVLSEHNLEALHHALAAAASQATQDGARGRAVSGSELSLGVESLPESLPPTLAAAPALGADDGAFEDLVAFEDLDDDDFDASLYDDPIIAAANAEALENDDEGFYGQEFGFYAHAHGSQTTQLTSGGYFGPRTLEGLTRSYSSRGTFREPSLTPITERSEWSTRNSVISLPPHGAGAHSGPSLASPGLAQLVDLGPREDEMTLSALMRLRRGAWGGSNGSLRSSSASPPPHPPHAPHASHAPSSHRGSFTGLSDVSPTVHSVPPDLPWGSSSTSESPRKDAETSGGSSPPRRVESSPIRGP
ncbi:hypothetical protein BDW42DRAFT_193797 [Aspergillus taichungensis]|uniref:Uncharacterized protein n=1 Tax=Aspergillus taichungensis TaxID=482145 RepID=A0A2J5HVM4_9EURO|nr:hypothetical protein BDW42DRAFT_193797 [Aspergillus taichungensis]